MIIKTLPAAGFFLLLFTMSIPPLKEGQTIGVVVPARKANEAELRRGCSIIESWGLNVQYGAHCFKKDNNYLAASDKDRLDDLQKMLDDPHIHAVVCGRGGYGTTRILDRLDFTELKKKPKWIIGFSDITALHLKLHQLNIESIHGCMPVQYAMNSYNSSVESLKRILFSEKPTEILARHNRFNRDGATEAIVIGGNLSMIVDSLGTSTAPDTRGKILIIEEIDELLYKIDRMFVQLKRAGKLDELAGLIVGHMTDIKDTELPFGCAIQEMILEKISAYNYPVAFDFPIGHDAPNMAWVHSSRAAFRVNEKGSKLVFEP